MNNSANEILIGCTFEYNLNVFLQKTCFDEKPRFVGKGLLIADFIFITNFITRAL